MFAYGKELEKLIKIFLQAENELIKEINRQQAHGFVDYHTTAQLHRVQKILTAMKNKSFKYIPKMIREQFYIGRRIGAQMGYANASGIISEIGIREIEELIRQMETRVVAMTLTAQQEITQLFTNAIIVGRRDDDTYRTAGLKGVIKSKAIGGSTAKTRKYIIDDLKKHGITGFIDKAGRRWRLSAYANMVARTTARQSTNIALIESSKSDLLLMSSHYGSCPICKPLEGRVYSKSGTNPYYPPLAWAFAKIDKNGADTLDNSWMTIHPNCRHIFIEWTEKGKTQEEIQAMRQFSSFTSNPPNPQNAYAEEEYNAYQKKIQGERKFMQAEKEWREWRRKGFATTFRTYLKHKVANNEKYKEWKKQYK